jgi:transcriptional regulator with XRE-family HTH domain
MTPSISRRDQKYPILRFDSSSICCACWCDMSQRTISGIETGRICPTEQTLRRFFEVFNIPFDGFPLFEDSQQFPLPTGLTKTITVQ